MSAAADTLRALLCSDCGGEGEVVRMDREGGEHVKPCPYGCSTPGCSNLPPVGERDCDACMLASLDPEIEARLADVRAEQVATVESVRVAS